MEATRQPHIISTSSNSSMEDEYDDKGSKGVILSSHSIRKQVVPLEIEEEEQDEDRTDGPAGIMVDGDTTAEHDPDLDEIRATIGITDVTSPASTATNRSFDYDETDDMAGLLDYDVQEKKHRRQQQQHKKQHRDDTETTNTATTNEAEPIIVLDPTEIDHATDTTPSEIKSPPHCCCGCTMARVGNVRIVSLPFATTSNNKQQDNKRTTMVIGPHWIGPIVVMWIIGIASHHFITASLRMDRYITAGVCGFFTLLTYYFLICACYTDPGIVPYNPQRLGQDVENVPTGYRWCDYCNCYQPPKAVHCRDCNVCIEKYDHHCLWMGQCIGRYNFVSFMRFNLSWLSYLAYAIVWVTIIAPIITSHHNHPNVDTHQPS